MLYLMLPMYNEETAIVRLLENVKKSLPELKEPLRVVIVDDGSSDNSVKNVKLFARQNPELPINVIPHNCNRGLGQAMRTGIYHLAQTVADADIVFTMDADNTHMPECMPSMKHEIQAGAEIVIASRYCTGGDEVGLRMYRQILSRGASTLMAAAFRYRGVRDYSCGYRAYSGRLLKAGFAAYGESLIREDGFTCMAELLVKLYPLAKRATEVPLVLRYDLKGGASKMRILRTVWRYLFMIRQAKRDIKAVMK
ncbi:MAG: glycosyltransferase [bacterium]|nr:glycosyltransferase [bacterium]